jgi:hypothetical protein
MNLVGIDFSINSPAFCCLKDGVYTWGSVTRSERSKESLIKNTKKPYYWLDCDPNFTLDFIEKQDLPEDYSGRERMKIGYFLSIVDGLWDSIKGIMGNSDFSVAMEGLSFSSNGNALIDISMATSLLRERIIREVGVDSFYVFSPTSIKKFALKGNAKKDELYEALCNFKEDETNLEVFTRMLATNKEEWVTKAKQVNKPIDDIVDATWINLYLKKELEGIYEIKRKLETEKASPTI